MYILQVLSATSEDVKYRRVLTTHRSLIVKLETSKWCALLGDDAFMPLAESILFDDALATNRDIILFCKLLSYFPTVWLGEIEWSNRIPGRCTGCTMGFDPKDWMLPQIQVAILFKQHLQYRLRQSIDADL